MFVQKFVPRLLTVDEARVWTPGAGLPGVEEKPNSEMPYILMQQIADHLPGSEDPDRAMAGVETRRHGAWSDVFGDDRLFERGISRGWELVRSGDVVLYREGRPVAVMNAAEFALRFVEVVRVESSEK